MGLLKIDLLQMVVVSCEKTTGGDGTSVIVASSRETAGKDGEEVRAHDGEILWGSRNIDENSSWLLLVALVFIEKW